MKHSANRRDFLKFTAAASAGFWIAGRQSAADELSSKSPNERINLACIGIGGKGDGDSDQAAKHANLIAICDIDDKRLESKARRFPKAQRFNDFRQLFDKLGKDFDAVTVSTPDHTHAVATMMAIKAGKHVYTQKPMTHDIWEARQLRLAARQYGVSTQMGNQGTATDMLRSGVEAIQAGAIGPVREVHVWTDRPIWPQSPVITAPPPEAPVPAYVHWDDWLGTAPARPYAEKISYKTANGTQMVEPYHPRNWRGWWDFGTGALGDMGCHLTNMPFMALKLAHPDSIYAECEQPNPYTYPGWAKVAYQFPARGELPPVKFTWYEGHRDGQLVLPPSELVDMVLTEYKKILVRRKDKQLKSGKPLTLIGNGAIIVGDKGVMYGLEDVREWQLLPVDKFADFKAPPQTLPRNPLGGDMKTVDEGQKIDWLAAIKGGPKAMANFDYAGMLTEFILLGNVAIRANGKKLEWDGPNMKFPNAPEADRWLKRTYRAPWSL